jgi:hypothetical protein
MNLPPEPAHRITPITELRAPGAVTLQVGRDLLKRHGIASSGQLGDDNRGPSPLIGSPRGLAVVAVSCSPCNEAADAEIGQLKLSQERQPVCEPLST